MLRTKQTATLLTALIVFFALTQAVNAWTFLERTYPAPLDQCLTCHTSNNAADPGFGMNPFGAIYVEPNHLRLFKGISRHFRDGPDTPDCNDCHGGRNWPIVDADVTDPTKDADSDGFSNPAELAGGTLPGDSTSFPSDNTAPTITAFSLPATSMSLTVMVNSFSATDDVGVTGYMITDSSNAPMAGEAGWSTSAPTSYTCTAASVYTLYAWAKDAAGNVSAAAMATVDTTPSSQRTNEPPVAVAGPDQSAVEGDTVILTAVNSTDDLAIITYVWTQLDGPGGNAIMSNDPAAVMLSDAGAITPTFVAPAVDMAGASLTFRLTVTDGDAESASDEVSVSVSDNGTTHFDGMPGVVSTVTDNGDPIGISAGGSNACIQLTTMSMTEFGNASATQPDNMIYGVVDFEMRVTDPANCSITIHFAEPAPADYKWYKYTDQRGWFDFDRSLISNGTGEGAVFNADRTAVTLYIDDNSEFDGNPADGIIQDPGGLGSGTTTAISVGSNSFGGDAGGGCFIMTSTGR